jgi:hypothetical protein
MCAAAVPISVVSAGSASGDVSGRGYVALDPAELRKMPAEKDVAMPRPETSGVGPLEFADAVREKARRILGERYVELWVNRAQDRFVIGAVEPTSADRERVEEEVASIAQVDVVERQVSREELDRAYKAVIDSEIARYITVRSRNYERGVIGLSVIPERVDTVASHLGAESTWEVITGRARVEALSAPFSSVDVSDAPRITVEAADPVRPVDGVGTLPWKSGKRINSPNGSCTTAFTVSGVNPASRYGLTAGHCGTNGTPWSLGSATATLQNNAYQGVSSTVADAAVMYGGGNSNSHVYVPEGNFRDVVAQSGAVPSADPTVPYTWTCFSGASTIEQTQLDSCGYINSVNVSITNAPIPTLGFPAVTLSDAFSVAWTSGPQMRAGDSGGGIYGLNPDGTAIALGIASSCQRPAGTSVCDVGPYSYFSKVSNALASTGTTLLASGRPPFGVYDAVSGGAGTVSVSGWIIDPDLARTPTTVHVYVGGSAGSGAPGYAITANAYRPDVGAAYPNTGNLHGFSAALPAPAGPNVPVHVYGIDVGGAWAGNIYLGVRNATVN